MQCAVYLIYSLVNMRLPRFTLFPYTTLFRSGLQKLDLLQVIISLPLGLCTDYYTTSDQHTGKTKQEAQGKINTVQLDFKKFGPSGRLGFTLQQLIQSLLKRFRSFSGLGQRRPFGLQQIGRASCRERV